MQLFAMCAYSGVNMVCVIDVPLPVHMDILDLCPDAWMCRVSYRGRGALGFPLSPPEFHEITFTT